ncbi:aminotransferase class I/II-fold pyridoxal phosphate-dependent enzyme [Streptomyces sp. NPDC021096]|uniref:aminotransferase class I/II-fold pyridoxal phosphate-dependent enzyme n=1 Tax=Streptomyces sp. NPDC021096 TaxID=3154792 RepID=UPI0033EDEB39
MPALRSPAHPYSRRWSFAPDGAIPLTTADMDLATDPLILGAITERLAHPLAYPPPYTTGGLGDLLADHYRTRYRADVTRTCFWLLAGTLHAAYLILSELLRPGDEALFLAPSYRFIPEAITHAGAAAVPVPLDPDRGITRDDVEQRITARTRAIHLCNPHNPTGHMLSRCELAAIADAARDHDLAIVSDEIHCRLILDPQLAHIPIATLDEDTAQRTFTLDGPTKSHNLAGLGGAIVWTPDASALRNLRHRLDHRAAPARAVQQAAIAAAYATDSPWLTHTLHQLRRSRGLVEQALRPHQDQVTYRPAPATYLAWLDFHDTFDTQPAHEALAEHGVLLEPGPEFGAPPRRARLSFATAPELLDAALDRITSALTARQKRSTR